MNDTLKGAIAGAVISGLFGVAAAFIAKSDGKSEGQQLILDEINSQFSIVNGDNNAVTINSIDDFIEDYQYLQAENKSLRSQNTQYFDELTKVRDESDTNSNEFNNEIEQLNIDISRLNEEINAFPSIQFRDIALSIDGNNIPINSSNSCVVVDNRTYYSDDFINSILDTSKNISVQDGTMYIGKIIKDKASLLDKWVVDKYNVDVKQSAVDSYGNTHANSLYFYKSGYIIYNLNAEYCLLKFKISISEDANINLKNILTIKADDEIVYTSPELTKTMKPFDEIDIPIHNCSLLRIEFGNVAADNCLLSNIEVYN